jgi:hypothetical protein
MASIGEICVLDTAEFIKGCPRLASDSDSECTAATFPTDQMDQLADTSGSDEDSEPCTPPPPPGLADVPLSLGSVLHGSGECKPCAWFWKPGGCQNGRQCRHCHACPQGELIARRKANAVAKRAHVNDTSTSGNNGEQVGRTVVTRAAVGNFTMHPNGQVSCAGECAKDPMLPPPGLSLIAPTGVSLGSAAHATGACKPCAWFWKPQGCQNGNLCRHCHACPPGELKARNFMNSATKRIVASTSDGKDACRDVNGNQGFPIRREVHVPAVTPSRPEPVRLALAAAFSHPSKGSSLHGAGKCVPCAWYWKPQGCSNGKECNHCHSCGEGEIKTRKKAKETAMRLGALAPIGESTSPSAFGRPLKLLALL